MKTSISATTTKTNTLGPLELLLLITACILCRQDLNNMSKRYMNHKIRMRPSNGPARPRSSPGSALHGAGPRYSRAMTSQIPCELVSYSRKNKAANFGYIRTISLVSRATAEFRR